jgi:hypothetical protein
VTSEPKTTIVFPLHNLEKLLGHHRNPRPLNPPSSSTPSSECLIPSSKSIGNNKPKICWNDTQLKGAIRMNLLLSLPRFKAGDK